jgi:spermidine synthase
MIPWLLLDVADAPGGGQLRLMRRGDEYSIRLGANELMNSRLSGSEEALATIPCDRIRARANPRLLIGGLGMGFTLRAALGALSENARVDVAELVPAVIRWAQGPMAPMFDGCLSDARVSLRESDVGRLIRAARSDYDAILLDVDNGPEGLTRSANDSLYDAQGLSAARVALRPSGILAVWSSGPDEDFTRRLRRAGFGVEDIRVRAHRGRRGARHVVWVATATRSSSA